MICEVLNFIKKKFIGVIIIHNLVNSFQVNIVAS